MIYEKHIVPVPGGDVEMTVYAPDNYPEIDPQRKRRAVIMCPGGGYWMRSDREAEPVALQLIAKDICVFVLHYAVRPAVYPLAVTQLAAAVAYVREHAAQFHVQADKVAVMGYSAGGHLAASLGVRWHEPWLSAALGRTPEEIKPDGMVLCYPVITGGPFTHEGSMENLTGSSDKNLWLSQSLEELVTEQTPKAFLWHTYTDAAVPVENSLFFFTAMRRCGVSGELHIYPQGAHGLSLGTELTYGPQHDTSVYKAPDLINWIDMAARWLKQM